MLKKIIILISFSNYVFSITNNNNVNNCDSVTINIRITLDFPLSLTIFILKNIYIPDIKYNVFVSNCQ